MTQLERELKATLKMQEQIFKDELKEVTTAYEKYLKEISTAYTKQMSEALEVIERQNSTITKQSEALEKYESISTNWQISIDKEQVSNLEGLFTKQRGELESLQRQLNSLGRKL